MRKRTTSILIGALWTAGALLWSQEFRGTITGTVTDPQGAVVPQTQIRVDDAATGSRYLTTSNSEGLFVVPFLPPGIYRVTVEKSGTQDTVVRIPS
ncbi:MAG TPA: carboxypeptidase-like regulatory domain-containing protein [Bryobacteraceae bacterium]|nr:carboxypeptidase-like regulatory domain-containing protein [Bryobacteraceae bacterium]